MDASTPPLCGSLYYYSQPMAALIETELSHKLAGDELDLDKDPHSMVGDLIHALQHFDAISGHKTLEVLRPKLEQWLAVKLVNVREVVARAIAFENWQPANEVSAMVFIRGV